MKTKNFSFDTQHGDICIEVKASGKVTLMKLTKKLPRRKKFHSKAAIIKAIESSPLKFRQPWEQMRKPTL